MKEILFFENYKKIKEETDLFLKYLHAAETTNIDKYPETYEKLVSDCSIKAEKVACSVRHIIYNTTSIKKSEHMSKVAGAQDIRIMDNGQWLSVVLPILMQRKKHKNSEFLTDPLFYALSEYSMANPINILSQCVICFRHIYDRSLPERRIRDYDNIEEKQVLDVIALFTLCDDSGKFCDVFNTTAKGDTDCTEIYVMPPENFLSWLKEYSIF